MDVIGPCPHPALRATFYQREKGSRRVALSLWERVALSERRESKGRVRARTEVGDMDFDLSKPQKLIKDSARELLARECRHDRVRSLMETETAFDPALWQAIADQGWTGLLIPEAYGGLGLGVVELAAVAEEIGRACMPGPVL